jgi:uncharacterized membrane protein YdjX (TVP38/TMEM64 family)
MVFGGWLGGSLSLIGNVLGAGIACQLMRSLLQQRRHGRHGCHGGGKEHRRLAQYQQLIEKHGLLIVTLLRVNPLTSSDLVSYAAGLTRVPTGSVMLGTLIGMAPLCYLQSYLSASLFAMFPWLIWGLVLACLLYAVALIVLWHRMGRVQPD